MQVQVHRQTKSPLVQVRIEGSHWLQSYFFPFHNFCFDLFLEIEMQMMCQNKKAQRYSVGLILFFAFDFLLQCKNYWQSATCSNFSSSCFSWCPSRHFSGEAFCFTIQFSSNSFFHFNVGD